MVQDFFAKTFMIIVVCVCLYLAIKFMLPDLSEDAQNTTLYAIIGLAAILFVFVILPSVANY